VTGRKHIVVVSDIHHAGELERQRRNFEWKDIANPFLRLLARGYFRYLWNRDPLGHAALLDRFIERVPVADLVVANGDFTVDSGFVGVSDDDACQSAGECLTRLRTEFGSRFHATIGDHELGKVNLFSKQGGLRLESWKRTTGELALKPFWRLELGNYVILGVTSTLVSLPVYEKESLPGEWASWQALRETHLAEINQAFSNLHPRQRVLLFCHDPTALPFLGRLEAVRSHLPQLELTIIGHLHTNLVLRQSRLPRRRSPPHEHRLARRSRMETVQGSTLPGPGGRGTVERWRVRLPLDRPRGKVTRQVSIQPVASIGLHPDIRLWTVPPCTGLAGALFNTSPRLLTIAGGESVLASPDILPCLCLFAPLPIAVHSANDSAAKASLVTFRILAAYSGRIAGGAQRKPTPEGLKARSIAARGGDRLSERGVDPPELPSVGGQAIAAPGFRFHAQAQRGGTKRDSNAKRQRQRRPE
jgi:hypothetical protein